jgi:hypothetical protein
MAASGRQGVRLYRNRLVHWQLNDVLFAGDCLVFDELVQGNVRVSVSRPFGTLRSPRPGDRASPRSVAALVRPDVQCAACGTYGRHRLEVAPTSAAPWGIEPFIALSCTLCGHRWS